MKCRKYDSEYRDINLTKMVYSGKNAKHNDFFAHRAKPDESLNGYNVYFGELHGHTNLSDASPDIDSYFITARDKAKLDFCAISDHDHGGVGKEELWGEKWELTKRKVREYHQDGKFVTILAYEKDAYPWYNNLVLYYSGDEGEMVRGKQDGEITEDELRELLKRKDILTIPHTTSFLHSGCDFNSIPLDLMTPLIEVYSRWGVSEFFGNENPAKIETVGGFWQDALEAGAKMGCIAGSDDHNGFPGLVVPDEYRNDHLRYKNPGTVAVLAKSLTREDILEAIRKRRCYATMGARIKIDFQINGNVMGSEFTLAEQERRDIFIGVESAETPINKITIVKNSKDIIIFNVDGKLNNFSEMIYEYRPCRVTDYFYLRIELVDGRKAWTSPIWVTRQ